VQLLLWSCSRARLWYRNALRNGSPNAKCLSVGFGPELLVSIMICLIQILADGRKPEAFSSQFTPLVCIIRLLGT